MSGITQDAFLSGNAATRRLYDPAFKLSGRTTPVSSDRNDGAGGRESRGAAANLPSIQHADETPDSEDESCVPDELGSSSGSNDGGDGQKMAGAPGGDLEHGVLPEAHVRLDGVQPDACCLNNEQPAEEGGTLNQAPKRPEKPVHCPRCKSLDTKFCYFNNYNANQPRHFCRNCQRYWTAGGTLRNVPVGAGRRKNKHTGAHARGMLPDVEMVRSDPPDHAQHFLFPNPVFMQPGQNGRSMKNGLRPSNPQSILPLNGHSFSSSERSPSGGVLSSEQESPLCISTSMAPFTSHRPEVLQGHQQEMSQAQEECNASMHVSPLAIGIQMEQSTADEKNHIEQNTSVVANESSDGFLKPVARQSVAGIPAECSRPEISAPIEPEAGTASGGIPKYVDAALAWASGAPFSFMGGGPWPYGANLGWPNALPAMALANAAQGGIGNPMPPFGNPAQIASSLAGSNPAQAGVQPPWAAAMGPWAGGIPWPLMQNPLWGPPGWGGAWTMPWAAPFTAAAAAVAAAAAAAAAAGPDLGSTILGKHPREQGEAKFQKVLVPKTLRIDDPGDAARSSIWSTLGLSPGSDKLGAGGIFGDCSKPKGGDKDREKNAHARSSNPAGFDRSASFQEKMVASSHGG